MQASETFGPEFESVSAARAFVRDVLRKWQLEALEAEASLLVTELCSNSVLHTRASYDVSVSRDDDKLRIGVRDASKHLPVAKGRTREAMTGRGLVLIEAYADDWGIDPHADGKTVWVELVLRSESSTVPARSGRSSPEHATSSGASLDTTIRPDLVASDIVLPEDLAARRTPAKQTAARAIAA